MHIGDEILALTTGHIGTVREIDNGRATIDFYVNGETETVVWNVAHVTGKSGWMQYGKVITCVENTDTVAPLTTSELATGCAFISGATSTLIDLMADEIHARLQNDDPIGDAEARRMLTGMWERMISNRVIVRDYLARTPRN